MNYWLLKSEPFKYSWDKLVKDKKATWDGVRNYAARNNLKAMKKGEQVLVYHSGESREVVGVSEVSKEHFQDPKDKTNTWVLVELKPVKRLSKTVTLDDIKKEKTLANMPLLKQSRLSVMPLTKREFDFIVRG